VTVDQADRTSVLYDRYRTQVFLLGKTKKYFFYSRFRMRRFDLIKDRLDRDAAGILVGLFSGIAGVDQAADRRRRVR
jgi:hypothetical protein